MKNKKRVPAVQIFPLGDAAVVISFGDIISPAIHAWVKALADKLAHLPFPGLIEYVPAYTNVTVFYNPWLTSQKGLFNPYDQVVQFIQNLLPHLELPEENNFRQVEIPVCYGGSFGPDLDFVAIHNNLSPEEVISIHAGSTYLVYLLGFAPGFPYLGGLDERISTPRKNTPRIKTPAGSVGIAGDQTGVYPLETPGGWQLIGRTPLALFNPNQQPATLLQAGDVVKFVPITPAEYEERRKQENEY